MFSADLSWTDPDTEKVGERRERIARERSSSSATPSIRSSKSSKSSILDDRELWWTTGLKKAKSLKPTKSARRPNTSCSTGHSRKGSSSLPQIVDTKQAQELRDPIRQPAYTYTTTLSPTLPSGASLDPPEYEVPELEGDFSSKRTNSAHSRPSHERSMGWKSPGKIEVIDEVHEVQQLSPRSFIARTTRRSSEAAEIDEDVGTSPSLKEKKKKKPYEVKIEGCLDLEALKLQEQPDENVTALSQVDRHPSYASGLKESHIVAWRPPSEWDISLPCQPNQNKQLPPTPQSEIAVAHSSTLELTRFQRFIRRMEGAGSKIILDRLKEEWHDPVDEEADEELTLEKQLWVLTAFQLHNLGHSKVIPRPQCNTGKILELYGNLSEVYQLSAMRPTQKVHYLTTEPQKPIPLPGNVSYFTVPQPGIIPFPYSDMSFSHIRASTLPSVVPSSKLPQLFRECHRLLAPGGMLEIRIMDAAPVRKTAGPMMRAWIEDRVSLNLEKLFRCSKPCMLVPSWLTDAGFKLSNPLGGEQNMQLPCAVDKGSTDVDGELATLVGRALWRDIWGGFVEDIAGEPRWWWEDDEVIQECLQRKTVFDCGSIFAYKD